MSGERRVTSLWVCPCLLSTVYCLLLQPPLCHAGSESTPDVEPGFLNTCLARSFRGEIIDPQTVVGSQGGDGGPPLRVEPEAEAPSPDPVALEGMARWALNYLRNNPDREGKYPYRPFFLINLLPENDVALRPGPTPPIAHSGWEIGDVELRMLRGMVFAREIAGEAQPDGVEQAVRDLSLGYVKGDMQWVPGDVYGRAPEERLGNTHGTSKIIGLCAELYARTGDQRWKDLGATLLRGLMRESVWQGGSAWVRCLLFDEQGKMFMPNFMGPSAWLEPVIRFWEVTGDPEALRFAVAMAQAVVTHSEPLGLLGFGPDGKYYGHAHLHTYAALGTLMVGLDTRNASYVEFAKRVYNYTKSLGTDTGWFPEWQGTGVEGLGEPWWANHSDHAETCVCGDMSGMAARLGQAGFTECYDDLERFVRDYLRWVQFFATPRWEELYRQRNGDKAEELMAAARRLQGGFIGSPEPNDLYCSAPPADGANHPGIDMMGCCPAEAPRILWEAWTNTVTRNDLGLFVNMSFNRQTPDLRVISFAPDQGRLTAVVRGAGFQPATSRAVYLRPPSWAPRPQVRAYRNGTRRSADWWGDYVRFEKVEPGDELTITYPLVTFRQKLTTARGIAGKERTWLQTWVGNTIVDIEPRGEMLPIFSGEPPKIPPPPS